MSLPKKNWKEKIFIIFYDISIFLLGIFGLFKILLRKCLYSYPSIGVYERIGMRWPSPCEGTHPLWIHAVSLGEIRSIYPLVMLIKTKFPSTRFLFTTQTQTAFQEAKKIYPFAKILFLPLDFSFLMERFFDQYQPSNILFVEGDVWFNITRIAKERGCKTALVSGRISEKSTNRFRYLQIFSKRCFNSLSLLLVQTEAYKKRFEQIGVDSTKIIVAGNLKYDREYHLKNIEERLHLREIFNIDSEDWVITIGSTHQGEEESILLQLLPLFNQFRRLKVFLVPRHPERYQEVEDIIKKLSIKYCRLSLKSQLPPSGVPIILVDQMGILIDLYGISDISIVAGSFTSKVGGHNILEPLGMGSALIFGPSMFAQEEMRMLVLEAHAGIETPLTNLSEVVLSLLKDTEKRKDLQSRGKELIKKLQGSASITLSLLEKAGIVGD